MEFRQVTTPDEITAVAALAEEIWTEYWPSIIGADQTAYMIKQVQSTGAISNQIAEGMRYALVRSAGIWCGYYAILPDEPRMMISKFYLKADSRGTGIGHAMLKAIKSAATELNCSVLWLVVNRRNVLAIAAYEAMGFTCTGTRVKDIGNGFVMDDFIYELTLR